MNGLITGVLIDDDRSIKEFKKETFSGHSKNDVIKAMCGAIEIAQYEYAIHWAYELLCSGLVDTLWNGLFQVYVDQVNRMNPMLILYLCHRFYSEFIPLRESHLGDITRIRNSVSARKIIMEVIGLLCMSHKGKLPNYPKVTSEDYEASSIRSVCKAPASNYANSILKQSDPVDIYIPINELAYAIREDNKDCVGALYWIKWLMEWDKQLKKAHEPLKCEDRRVSPMLEEKYRRDVVWVIWEVINKEVSSRVSSDKQPRAAHMFRNQLEKVMGGLFKAYLYQWEPSSKTTRRNYLVYAIVLLTDNIEWNVEICKDKIFIKGLVMKSDDFMIEFKNHEKKVSTGDILLERG